MTTLKGELDVREGGESILTKEILLTDSTKYCYIGFDNVRTRWRDEYVIIFNNYKSSCDVVVFEAELRTTEDPNGTPLITFERQIKIEGRKCDVYTCSLGVIAQWRDELGNLIKEKIT